MAVPEVAHRVVAHHAVEAPLIQRAKVTLHRLTHRLRRTHKVRFSHKTQDSHKVLDSHNHKHLLSRNHKHLLLVADLVLLRLIQEQGRLVVVLAVARKSTARPTSLRTGFSIG